MRKWNADMAAVAQRAKAERGMSLVEATIVLLILATLTAVIAPSMGDYLEDARDMKAKEDVEAIGISIKRFLRDTGLQGMKFSNGTQGLTKVNRLDILQTEGTAPSFAASATTFLSDDIADATARQWNTFTNTDDVQGQLVENLLPVDNYPIPTTGNRGRGWRGSYLNAAVGADPWGNRYYANTVFLVPASDAAGGGNGDDFWTNDTFVITAGPDSIMQTPVGGTSSGGTGVDGSDDVIFVLSGGSR